MTQKQLIKNKLQSGEDVSNYWAIQNYILRLGAIIHSLKKEGMDISSEMRGKECVYRLQVKETLFS